MRKVISEFKMEWKDVALIVVGSFLLSFSFQVFILPNDVISGGIASLSIIIYELFGISPALIQYAFNIPLLIISYLILGKDVAFKSILGSLLFPFFTGLVSTLQPWTTDQFLGAVFGGLLGGIGIGLVYKAQGSTGGTSIIAQIITKYTGMTLGSSSLIADGSIIVVGLIIFDLEAIMYGMISLVVTSRVIDIVLVGGASSKTVLIISDAADEIRQETLGRFERGVTLLDVRGGYGNSPKEMLMVVISEREITALQQMIIEHDDDAFVVFMPASEVLGRGFSLEKYLPLGQQQSDYLE